MPYLRGSFSSSSSSSSSSCSKQPPLSPMSARDSLEPIAICGMACRLPGATSSPSALWDLLISKRTANSRQVPSTRFNISAHYHKNPNRPGSINIPGGYFLDGPADTFDPTFFNITPVEAMWMDPQQRKMLEVCYEALESAGIPLEKASGSNTGVFLGSFTADYQAMTYHDPDFRHSYAATGVDQGIISARVSNVFDLSGPSSTINTACSSSVYAIHSACNALRARDCDAALVGGVNLILSVEQHMNIAKLGVQSPTSFCHTFDESADGYGRAEGVGVLYIKRLSDALRDGDVVRAVIRSSAVGANGKVPGYGITFPSIAGQERVIRQAYKRADLDPDETAYVEVHGTGTPVGDPIEVRALSAAMMGDTRGSRPLMLGAIKPNIGHSEAASGVSAIIKAVMVVERGVIPGVAGLKNLNPGIREEELNVRIARENYLAWPEGYKSRRVGVSSFGYGGTNGHVVIENVEALERDYQHGSVKDKAGYDHSTSRPLLVTFSAHDKVTLSRNIDAHAAVADRYFLADLAHTLNTRRSKFLGSRAYAIVAEPTLSASTFSLPNLKISSSSSQSNKQKTLGFIFTGQGSQWPGAGHQALLTFPVFLSTIRRLDRVLESGVIQPLPSFSLEEELSRPASISRVTDADLSQPTLVALELATVDLLASWGITPNITVGHSAGESAAAYAAGLCSGPEVIIAAYYRGYCAAKYGVEGGGMLAVGLGAEDIVTGGYLTKLGKKVVIACENSPKSVTLSGPRPDIRLAKEVFDAEGIFAREVRTPMAYHSSAMEPVAQPMVELIRTACARLDSLDRQWRYPRRMMISSSVKGNPVIVDEREITPQYWADNLTGRVLFDTAVAKMAQLEETLGAVVEVGPHSALAGPFKQIRQGHGLDAGLAYVPTMVRNEDSARSLLATAGDLFLLGFDHMVDLARVNQAEAVVTTPWMGHQQHKRAELKPLTLVDLPPYQWNYERTYSAEPRASVEYRQLTHPRHDLLGNKILGLSSQSMVWRNVLRVRDIPWLLDHRLGGSNMFPAAGHMALGIEAVRQHVEVHGPNNGISVASIKGVTLRNVALKAALVVPDSDDMALGPHGGLEIQTRLTEDSATRGLFHFTVSSLSDPVKNIWTVHSSGDISLVTDSSLSMPLGAPELSHQQLKSHSAKTWNQAFQRVGFSYTRPFNAIENIRSSTGTDYTAACSIPLTTKSGLFEDEKGDESRYMLHPATVDSLLQLCIISIHKGRARDMKFGAVPTLFDEVTLYFPTAVEEPLSPVSSSAGSVFDGDSGIGITVDTDDERDATYDGQTGRAIAWNDAIVSNTYVPGTTRKFKTHARLFTPAGDIALDIKGLHTVAYEAALPPSSADEVDVEMVITKMEEKLPSMPYAGVVWKPDISLNNMIKLDGSSRAAVPDLVGLLNHKDPISSLLVLDSASQLDIGQIVERTCLTAHVSICGREWDLTGEQPGSRIVKILGQDDLDSLTGSKGTSSVELVICSLEDTWRLLQDDELLKPHLSLYDQSVDASSKGLYLVRQSGQDHFRDQLNQAGFEILNEVAIPDQNDSPCVLVLVSPFRQASHHDQPCSHFQPTLDSSPSSGISIKILYSSSHSSIPTALTSALTSQGHTVDTTTIQEFNPTPNSSKAALTILYNPDGSILAQHTQPDEQVFSSLKRLLSSGQTQPIIWLTSGVYQGSCSSPMGASVSGFLRVIREEDKFVNVKVVDHGLDERIEDVATAVVNIASANEEHSGTGSGSEREFWVKDGGVVHISRIVANGGLNTQAVQHGVNGTEERTLEEGKPLRAKLTPGGLVFEANHDFEAKGPGKGELDVQVEAVEYSNAGGSDTDSDNRSRIVCGRVIAVGQGEDTLVQLGTRVVAYIPGENRHDTIVRLESASCVPCPIGNSTAVADMVGLLPNLCKASLDLDSAAGGSIQEKTVLLIVPATSPFINCCRLLSRPQRFELSIVHTDDESLPDLKAIGDFMQNAGSSLIVISSEFSSPLPREIWQNMPSGASFCCLANQDGEARITSPPEVAPFLRSARFSTATATDITSLFQDSPHSLVKTLRSVIPAAIGQATSSTDKPPLNIITPTTGDSNNNSTHVLSYLTRDSTPPSIFVYSPHRSPPELTFSPNDIYLLIGCLGGLGRSLSSWLVSRGAKHLHFLSRSGSSSPAAQQLIQSITLQGAQPKVLECDVSNLDSVTCVIQSIVSSSGQGQTIRGVIHAAMVLHDGFFNSPTMTSSKFAASLRPKVDGALNIQTALAKTGLEEGLDFFISTSSISATIGQPGQSNYAAGNAVLDNLALRHQGQLEGMTSLVLPMILGVGVVAESSTVDLEGAISRRGMYGVDEKEMLNAFEDAISLSLRKKKPHFQQEQQEEGGGKQMNAAVIMGLDPARLAKTWVMASLPLDEKEEEERVSVELDNAWIKEDARFRHINFLANRVLQVWEEGMTTSQKRGGADNKTSGVSTAKFTDQIAQLATTEEGGGGYDAALTHTARHIMKKCGAILMIPADGFDMEGKSVGSYGLDSMVGAELRNWLFKELGLNVAFQELLASSLSFGGLARLVLKGLGVSPPPPPSS
ncbi:hypothetical protein V8F33_007613 [Rhypophila sp. PSN 637]